MDILFLGTSSGTPTKQRNVSAVAVQLENSKSWYLVDCGEGTQHQILHTTLSLITLKAIFITHVHGDHCYGLIGLLASAALSGRRTPLVIIAPQALEEWLQVSQRLTDLHLPYHLDFIAVEHFSTWQDAEIRIEVTALSHRVPSFAYSLIEINRHATLHTEKLHADNIPQGAIWGQLKKGLDVTYQGKTLFSNDYLYTPFPARKIIIAGDNDQPERLQSACATAQLLVHESTYTEEIAQKVGEKVQHSSAAQVAIFAQNTRLPHLILTHFSPRYQQDIRLSPSIADIQTEALRHYTGQLFLATDFARYRLYKTGELVYLNG